MISIYERTAATLFQHSTHIILFFRLVFARHMRTEKAQPEQDKDDHQLSQNDEP